MFNDGVVFTTNQKRIFQWQANPLKDRSLRGVKGCGDDHFRAVAMEKNVTGRLLRAMGSNGTMHDYEFIVTPTGISANLPSMGPHMDSEASSYGDVGEGKEFLSRRSRLLFMPLLRLQPNQISYVAVAGRDLPCCDFPQLVVDGCAWRCARHIPNVVKSMVPAQN